MLRTEFPACVWKAALGKRILDERKLDLNMKDFPHSSVAWGLVIIF